tara:strand:- start:6502 stop:7197 length:696 start_codon:yes stop_codon:yes gene_type:complete
MLNYINKTKYKFLDIPYYYKVNDIFTDKPFVMPSKNHLLEFIENFKLNYAKSHLFKIILYGGYNSSSKNTPDVDIVISYNNIDYKNYEDIYDCMYFLTATSIEMFNMKIDLFYVDKPCTIWNSSIMDYCITQNMNKLKEHDQNIMINQGELLTIMISRTLKSKKKSYYHIIDRKKNIVITINNEKELVKDDHKPKIVPFSKQTKHVLKGRIYYNDVVLIENNIINYNYFKI